MILRASGHDRGGRGVDQEGAVDVAVEREIVHPRHRRCPVAGVAPASARIGRCTARA
ncbi:hypothetical protein BN2537_17019 [Streptomyces venezuelae]|nr:hypothetical protein BN2537_17019 [Streptomyces venezuelae]